MSETARYYGKYTEEEVLARWNSMLIEQQQCLWDEIKKSNFGCLNHGWSELATKLWDNHMAEMIMNYKVRL